MNLRTIPAIVLLAFASIGLFGCNDTAAGMAEDTKENTQAVADASEEMADNVQEGAEKAADDVVEASKGVAATTLTARIKSALIANPITNESNVKIDVDSTAEMVTLSGYVVTDKQKEEAEQIAKEIIRKTGASQKFENKLEVRK
ncbi:MAG: BON domain-containing protein [Fimbriimonadaceae bacterium]|nr:MAG: BON domain-containing protein [Fimbriimonadaceae bacterium]